MYEIKETGKWYEDVPYQECKSIIKERLTSMSRDFISVGYYLKYIRDKELYKEDGYASVWEFAEDNYGIKTSTASRWMAMNDKFSQGGNTPLLDDRYRDFGKSQLQEMLYLNDEQMEQAKPDMPAKAIRAIRKPDKKSFEECAAYKCNGCCDNCHYKDRDDCPYDRTGYKVADWRIENDKSVAPAQEESPTKEKPEALHFTAGDKSIDNAYGAMIAALVGNYLDNAYKSPDRECEAYVFGQTYKVLKRPEVTVFYTTDGRTFFDVENARLEQEYQWRQKNKPEPDIPEEMEGFVPAQEEPEQVSGEVIGFEVDDPVLKWPELLADIPIFDEPIVKDYLEHEEKDLIMFLSVDKEEELPLKVLQRKQMSVAGLRLLLELVRGENGHE